MAAIYQADIYCDECADRIKHDIAVELFDDKNMFGGLLVFNEHTTYADIVDQLDNLNESDYDSDDYPKYANGGAEADTPQHCGSMGVCLDADELNDGEIVGHCFGNDLTPAGEACVKLAVADGGSVAELWADVYSYLDFDTDE